MLSLVRGSFLTAVPSAFNPIIGAVFFIALVCVVPPARAEIKAGIATPPLAVPATVRVQRGGEVQILLRLYGPAQPVEYRVRVQPKAGKLSKPVEIEKASAVVVYRHSGEKTSKRDSFTYAAYTPRGVSSAVEVKIDIIDPPPLLAVPETIDFGEVLCGTRAERELTIENRGGGSLEGVLEMDGPWVVNGFADYRVDAGEKQNFTLVLNTAREGNFSGEVSYSSTPGRSTELHATVRSPVGVEPETIVLHAQGDDPSRKMTATLTNRTDESLRVEMALGGRLKGPESVELPQHGEIPVTLEIPATDTDELDETIQLVAGGFVKPVKVTAGKVGPVLLLSGSALGFGRMDIKEQGSMPFEVKNAGGERVFVEIAPEPPFKVTPEDAEFTLQPGEKREIQIACESDAPGRFSRNLFVNSYGRRQKVGLWAEVIGELPASTVLEIGPRVKVSKRRAPSPDERPKPEPALPAALPAKPGQVKIVELAGKSVTLEWKTDKAAHERLEIRWLKLDANRDLEISWLPIEKVEELSNNNGLKRVRVPELEPGTPYTFRVVSLNPGGEPVAASQEIQFFTPARQKARISLLPILIVVGAVLAWIVGKRRWRKWQSWQERMYGHN